VKRAHVLKVLEMRVDCDADALLVRVEPLGPGVCHEVTAAASFVNWIRGWCKNRRRAHLRAREVYAKENLDEPAEAGYTKRKSAGSDSGTLCSRGLENRSKRENYVPTIDDRRLNAHGARPEMARYVETGALDAESRTRLVVRRELRSKSCQS